MSNFPLNFLNLQWWVLKCLHLIGQQNNKKYEFDFYSAIFFIANCMEGGNLWSWEIRLFKFSNKNHSTKIWSRFSSCSVLPQVMRSTGDQTCSPNSDAPNRLAKHTHWMCKYQLTTIHGANSSSEIMGLFCCNKWATFHRIFIFFHCWVLKSLLIGRQNNKKY